MVYINQKATEKGLDPAKVKAVIKCESQYDSLAVGDSGNSHGLVQIHQPSHPDIHIYQATNPEFAINYITDEWSEGRPTEWSCYRILYGRK